MMIFINMNLKNIIREEINVFGTINELSTKGMGLLAFIRQKYETMDNSFTPRSGYGEKWYTKNDVRNELMRRFNINKDFAEEVMDYYLEHNFS